VRKSKSVLLEVRYLTALSVAKVIQRLERHVTCNNVDCLSKCGCMFYI
jgi:hypothetical protein